MKLKIGMAGCGMIARCHYVPDIKICRWAKLVGVCGKGPEEAQSFAEEMGLPRWYKNFETMVTDDSIDAVIVGTPNHLHFPQVLAAAAAGKHVLCEKPMALNMAQAEEMTRVCRAAGVVFMVAHHLRYKACNETTKKMVDTGELGDVSTAHIQWSFNSSQSVPNKDWHTDPSLSGGGQIMDVGSHCVDLLTYLFGPARRVSAFTRSKLYQTVEDTSVITIQFQNGVLATAEGSYVEAGTENSLEIFGNRSSLIVTGACSTDRYGSLRKLPGGERLKVESGISGYTAEVDHFARAVLDRFEPISSGEKVLETMRILTAAYTSAESGRQEVLTR